MKVFKEEQRFTQTWVVMFLVISAVVSLGVVGITYYDDPSQYTNSSLLTIIITVVLSCSLIFLFKLTTRIDEIGIHYKFFPFHFSFKTILWQDLDKIYVRKYDAISEYGGWGLKGGFFWRKSKGTAINVSGDIGIQLDLKNGKKTLIGTQKEQDAKSIINNYKNKVL